MSRRSSQELPIHEQNPLLAEAVAARDANAWLAFYCGTVVVSLLVYGLLQERLMSMGYGEEPNQEYFTMSTAAVFMNRLAASIFAYFLYRASSESKDSDTPLHHFAAVSILNIAATTCQYQALQFVAFPLQALAKSCKMIPAMSWTALIRGKKYTAEYWLIAFVVTGGCVAFIVGGEINSMKHRNIGTKLEYLGIILLVLFLAADGLTSVFEEKIMRDHSARTDSEPNRHEVMLKVNVISCIFSFIWLASSGEGRAFIGFASAHPWVLKDIAIVGTCSVISQWAIFAVIAHSSAVTLAATMNVRQIFGMVLSIVVFGHPITHLQAAALVLVSYALCHKIYRDFKGKERRGSQHSH